MSELDRDQDGELPKRGATLSDWRFFAFQNLDRVHFEYLDKLCKDFGVDYVVDQDSNIFLQHVGWVGFENDRRTK